MQTENPATPAPAKNTSAEDHGLNDAIRNYVRTYALWHGRPQAARRFGVSRHTLWRFLERGYLGRSLPRAVTGAVGDDPQAIYAATEELVSKAQRERKLLRKIDDALAQLEHHGPATHRLSRSQEDALMLICEAPLATVKELARLCRVPESTLRDRLDRLPDLGPRPQLRYFPAERALWRQPRANGASSVS